MDSPMSSEAARIRDYRHRAEEVRAIADGIRDSNCRNNLIAMAEDYERLAAAIESMKVRETLRGKTIH
jgi:hypothetical protein